MAGRGTMATAQAAPSATLARFACFDQVVELIRDNRDIKLLVEVEDNLRLANYAPGRIEFEMTAAAPRDLASRLATRLQSWTGARWVVSVVGEGGGQTIAEARDAQRTDLQARALAHPMVAEVLTFFPSAEIREVRLETGAAPDRETLAQADDTGDDWDPFEND